MNSDIANNFYLAPAKLNLFLHVTGVRSDGYHTIQTVFHLINLYDLLKLSLRNDSIITLSSSLNSNIKIEDNIAYKAAIAFQNYTCSNKGVDIVLQKNIPIGAGMGGGSSDAACILKALNSLWNINLSILELEKFSLKLGADIPIFLSQKNAWGEGVGEILTEIVLPKFWYIVIRPECTINTKNMYENPNLKINYQMQNINNFMNKIFCNEQTEFENAFQKLAENLYPEIKRIITCLKNMNQYPKLTGTGSCIFLRYQDYKTAIEIYNVIKSKMLCYFCKSI